MRGQEADDQHANVREVSPPAAVVLERQVGQLERRERRDEHGARPQPAGDQAHDHRVHEPEHHERRHRLGKADPGEVDGDRAHVAARVAGAGGDDQHGGEHDAERLRAAGRQPEGSGGVAIREVDDQRGRDGLRDEIRRRVELGAEAVRLAQRARDAAVDHVGRVAGRDGVTGPEPVPLGAQRQRRDAGERVDHREQILDAEHAARARVDGGAGVHVHVTVRGHAAPLTGTASSDRTEVGADASACRPSMPSATSARWPGWWRPDSSRQT